MSKKAIIAVVIAVVVLAVVGGWFWYVYFQKQFTPSDDLVAVSPLVTGNNNQLKENEQNTTNNNLFNETDWKDAKVWPEEKYTEVDYEGWQTYSNPKYRFAVKYPRYWNSQEISPEVNTSVLFGTPESKIGGYLWGLSIRSFINIEKGIASHGKQFSDRQEHREKIKINGMNALLVRITASSLDWENNTIYIHINDNWFIISGGKVDTEFKKFVHSLKFTD